MIALCPAMDTLGLSTTSVGVSAEATELQECVKRSFRHYLEPRLQLLLPEIQEAASEQASRVDEATIRAAELFAYYLPRFGPLPEVSVDPDGEISFDWIAPSGNKMFSVSVNNQSRLAYAGWFGEKSRIHGVEQLAENCPQEILRGIQKATCSERQGAS
jgi:hypothetical protein